MNVFFRNHRMLSLGNVVTLSGLEGRVISPTTLSQHTLQQILEHLSIEFLHN